MNYSKVTNSVEILVDPVFHDEVVENNTNKHVWAYFIHIINKNKFDIQLLSRHWVIIDANGKMNEVRGEGVVGKTPIIKPGECFKYNSSVNLGTSSGIMLGSYLMINLKTNKSFYVDIPAFSLDNPYEIVQVN